MKSLTRGSAFLVLFLLLGASFLVSNPQSTRADESCDFTFNDQMASCTDQYLACLDAGTNPDDCAQERQNCYTLSSTEKQDCDFATSDSPQAWPVIDEHFQWCLQGCESCLSEAITPEERWSCSITCRQFCRDSYPRH